MSQEYARGYVLPSSFGLEVEARRLHSSARAPGLGDVAGAVAIGAFPKAFDAFTCLAAAVFIFPQVLFPGMDRTLAVAASLGVCALAYAMGPLGEILFRAVDRRHGRGVRLTAARFMLGASTAAIAFLPAGALAVLFLAACRTAQGLALGGVRADSPALAQVALTREGRVSLAFVRSLGVLAALLLAAAIFAIFKVGLSAADFAAWGWRYPFVLGVAANTVALFADLRLLATHDREQAPDRPAVRLAAVDGARVD
ncbi:MFS transporter [Phenylobacterium soli]|nr:hypothetical protein [Phenylobacterium soli]